MGHSTAPLILGAALLLLAAVLWLEWSRRPRPLPWVKGGLSILFVAAALLQPWSGSVLGRWVLAGLCVCVAGDVLLAIPGLSAFRLGLVAFLVGHVCYAAAFFLTADLATAGWFAVAPLALFAAEIWRRLAPHLGTMRRPVAVYIAVISAMLLGAWLLLRSPGLPPAGRIQMMVGALLFYLSDLFVARQRFVAPSFANRLFGLPLYYAGQFLIAFALDAM